MTATATAYSVDDVRTIALVGHEVAGKTSLADALLFKAHAVERRGSVDDGTSVSDFDDQEKTLHYSIDSHVLHLDYTGKRIYLLDTPGKPDFVGQALGVLHAVETAVVVVNASAGIQVNTRRLFREAGKERLARMLVIDRLDGDNVEFVELLEMIRDTFGKGCVLFNAPIHPGHDVSGVVSILNPPEKAPAGCPIDIKVERSLMLDAIVESDEGLMEKYLEQGDVTCDELIAALPTAMTAGTVIPIFCVCTRKDKDIGVQELLDAIATFAPSPRTGVKRLADGDGKPLEPDEKGEFIGQVFKTMSDKFVGTLSFFRVFSGRLSVDQPIISQKSGKGHKAGGLMIMQGKQSVTVHDVGPGDIVAVAKAEDLHIGDTISNHVGAPKMHPFKYPVSMFGLAVEPKTRGDEQKISGSLHKIEEEDPTFHVSRDSQTKEMVITGMSQLHLDVLQKRLKSRFDLEIVTHEPKVAYRETITASGEGMHKHKKQTGGRGQFAEVHLRVYHLSREITNEFELHDTFANKHKFEKMRAARYDAEHNFAFIDHIVGGTIPNQFVPAVEKGCKELLERGALAGYRIQDCAVEVYFGKYHDVDSSEAAFKTAGRIAFRNAILAAHPVLLEPIVHIEVTVPTKYTGAILGDLNTKRARIESQDSLPGDLAVISGQAPLAEMTRYAAQLGSITQGQGAYTMDFSHYDTVPANVQQLIVSKTKLAKDEDE